MLHYAVAFKNESLVGLLIESGARIDLRDKNGKCAAEWGPVGWLNGIVTKVCEKCVRSGPYPGAFNQLVRIIVRAECAGESTIDSLSLNSSQMSAGSELMLSLLLSPMVPPVFQATWIAALGREVEIVATRTSGGAEVDGSVLHIGAPTASAGERIITWKVQGRMCGEYDLHVRSVSSRGIHPRLHCTVRVLGGPVDGERCILRLAQPTVEFAAGGFVSIELDGMDSFGNPCADIGYQLHVVIPHDSNLSYRLDPHPRTPGTVLLRLASNVAGRYSLSVLAAGKQVTNGDAVNVVVRPAEASRGREHKVQFRVDTHRMDAPMRVLQGMSVAVTAEDVFANQVPVPAGTVVVVRDKDQELVALPVDASSGRATWSSIPAQLLKGMSELSFSFLHACALIAHLPSLQGAPPATWT